MKFPMVWWLLGLAACTGGSDGEKGDSADSADPAETGDTGLDSADSGETGETADSASDSASDSGGDSGADSGDSGETGCTPTDWYTDADSDGYGDPDTATSACEAPPGTTALGGDCDDADADVHPDAPLTCYNGVDEDCTGVCELLVAIPGGKGIILQGETAASHADLDGDGVPDLVVGSWPASGAAGTASVYPGPLHADLPAPATVYTGAARSSLGTDVEVGDLDGDGLDDLAALDWNNVWHVWPGPLSPGSVPADGTEATLDGSGSSGIVSMVSSVTADLDGDGLAELLMGTDPYRGGTVYAVDGSWTGVATVPGDEAVSVDPGSGVEALGWGQDAGQDLDGDGVTDLAVAGQTNYYSGRFGYVAVLFGPLSGAYTTDEADLVLTASGGRQTLFGQTLHTAPDLGGDGYADLLVADNPALSIYSGLGAGEWGAASYAAHLEDVLHNDYDWDVNTTGDFDADGALDLLIGCPGCDPDARGMVTMFRGPLTGAIPASSAAVTLAGATDYVAFGTVVDVLPGGIDGTRDGAIISAHDFPGKPDADGAIYLFTGLP